MRVSRSSSLYICQCHKALSSARPRGTGGLFRCLRRPLDAWKADQLKSSRTKMNNTTFEEDEAFVPQVLPDYIAWTSLVLCSIILAVGVLGTVQL